MKTINNLNPLFLIRLAIATIFLSHSLHGVLNHTVNDFGEHYLNKVGFAPFGVYVAWALMAFEIVGSIFILFGKFLKYIVPVFIMILAMGIVLVHYPEGWYVVGPGRNGMEFSFVLILSLIAICIPVKGRR
ncbi:DoxX family protein [Pedobacter gandavensis]|uniref:DoxX family membrane protein n=1 Tax=Pedobacter gandavensis TaxID=2679963 RepID=A0ABR6ESE1_9SPHI|nr:DoxX family protein [Pedobacter gandavensis]MBB2147901.1 DoxX family membrane protein [Pedobacter gandavensis]